MTPAMRGSATSALPTSPPGPMTWFSTPGGTPASWKACISSTPLHAVSLATLKTTVLPATSAAPMGPPASAKGKLKGAITTQAPCGRSRVRLWLRKPGSGSSGSTRSKPAWACICSQYQRTRSAVSCTSPSASMRFLPISSATVAAMS